MERDGVDMREVAACLTQSLRYGFLKTGGLTSSSGLCALSTLDRVDCSTLLVTASISDGSPTVGTVFRRSSASAAPAGARTTVSWATARVASNGAVRGGEDVNRAESRRAADRVAVSRIASAALPAFRAGADCAGAATVCGMGVAAAVVRLIGQIFPGSAPRANGTSSPSRSRAAHAPPLSMMITNPATINRFELPRFDMLAGTRGVRGRDGARVESRSGAT